MSQFNTHLLPRLQQIFGALIFAHVDTVGDMKSGNGRKFGFAKSGKRRVHFCNGRDDDNNEAPNPLDVEKFSLRRLPLRVGLPEDLPPFPEKNDLIVGQFRPPEQVSPQQSLSLRRWGRACPGFHRLSTYFFANHGDRITPETSMPTLCKKIDAVNVGSGVYAIFLEMVLCNELDGFSHLPHYMPLGGNWGVRKTEIVNFWARELKTTWRI